MKVGDLVRLRDDKSLFNSGARTPMLIVREVTTESYPEFECYRNDGRIVKYWAQLLEPVNEKNP